MSGGASSPLAPGATVSLCAFRVGGAGYVLDLRRVAEILRPTPITRVPHGASFLEGVIQLRGEVVPVMDLRKRLGAPAPPPGPAERLLVTLVGRRKLALIVDRVTSVLRVPRSSLVPTQDLMGWRGSPFLGTCEAPDGLKLLLDMKALLVPDAPVEPPPHTLAPHGGG